MLFSYHLWQAILMAAILGNHNSLGRRITVLNLPDPLQQDTKDNPALRSEMNSPLTGSKSTLSDTTHDTEGLDKEFLESVQPQELKDPSLQNTSRERGEEPHVLLTGIIIMMLATEFGVCFGTMANLKYIFRIIRMLNNNNPTFELEYLSVSDDVENEQDQQVDIGYDEQEGIDEIPNVDQD